MTEKASFLVVGNTAADLVFTVSAPLPRDGKAAADGFVVRPGGQAANVAATLAMLGHGIRFLGPFGDDSHGVASRKALEDLGVDTRFSPTVAGCPHLVACVLVSGEGRSVVSYKDPGLVLDASKLDQAVIGDAQAVFTDGFEVPASLAVARLARRMGRTVFADMEVFLPGSLELVELADHLIAPADIVRELGEHDDLPLALAHVLSMGPSAAVATHGREGAVGLARGMGKALTVPAETCDVVDSTGAGDAFHAGYMSAVMQGAGIEAAMRFATRLAAAKCRAAGSRLSPSDIRKALEGG